MSKVKIFSMYLPQYHETEENSKFWGKGFTDWVSTKNAVSLYEGHKQPVVPLNNNYYDLSRKDDIMWQAEIAKKYGIDGWGIYHYWFSSNERTLTKPAEILLANKDIEIPFFFAWDNATWKRTWSKIKGNDWSPLNDNINKNASKGPEILIEYKLGEEEDWKIHFEYLIEYFKDDRYIKHNNKPIFMIYNFSKEILDMEKYWNELAKNVGFDGIEIIYSYNPFHRIPRNVKKFRYEPLYSGWGNLYNRISRFVNKNKTQKKIKIFDYEKVWKRLIRNSKFCYDSNMYYGAFVGYDDSPRRGNKGKAIINASPQLFKKYLKKLIAICEKKEKEFIFLTAWNEWGEGAHLEPDTINGYQYLEKIKEIKEEKYEEKICT